MSIPFNPGELRYAVVEYLATTHEICDPVDYRPEQETQYRIVCLAPTSEDAWKITHLLRGVQRGAYTYSVSAAEPLAACEHGRLHCERCATGIYDAETVETPSPS
jgi:hypothetical protein